MFRLMIVLSIVVFTEAVNFPGGANCWSVTEKKHYPGLNQVQITDTDSCLVNCYYSDNCYIVDYDTNTKPQCWVQKKVFPVDASSLKPQGTVTNYILDRNCKNSDLGCWTVTPNHHHAGLEKAPFHDVSSCLNHCINNANCYVVDYDTKTNPPCWIQNKNMVVDIKSLKPLGTCTNFILDNTCKKPVAQTVVKQTSETLRTCWLTKNNTHYSGKGLTQTDKKTLLDCLQYCISLENCQVVDYDVGTSPPCWVQTVTDKILASAFVSHKTANTYVFDRTCLKKGVGTSETYTEEYVYDEEK